MKDEERSDGPCATGTGVFFLGDKKIICVL